MISFNSSTSVFCHIWHQSSTVLDSSFLLSVDGNLNSVECGTFIHQKFIYSKTWIEQKPTFPEKCLQSWEYRVDISRIPLINGNSLAWKQKWDTVVCLNIYCFLFILFCFVLCFLEFIWEGTFPSNSKYVLLKKKEIKRNNWRRVHISYGCSLLCWIINTWCMYCTIYFCFICNWLCQTETVWNEKFKSFGISLYQKVGFAVLPLKNTTRITAIKSLHLKLTVSKRFEWRWISC